jgi:cyclic pyranopterin phosphate synthase
MGILVDKHGRVIDYLRVSITDLCNFRCVYCRPPEGVKLVAHEDILRYEEILRVVRLGCRMGIRKIRITGGEPLVRRGVVEFISQVTAIQGLDDVALTTNGARLAQMAEDLKQAGLKRINVSLDSLDRERFKRITGFDGLQDVLLGIRKSFEVGLAPVKINVVLLKDMNESDVPEFARLTLESPIDVRFIERMPFGADCVVNSPDSFSAEKALHLIRTEVGDLFPLERGKLDGPATMFRLAGAKGRIGIIDPVTGHFCGTCNRLRLTARGTLRPCLLSASEIDLKTALRSGASDEEVADIMLQAVSAKPGGRASGVKICDAMNMIGG